MPLACPRPQGRGGSLGRRCHHLRRLVRHYPALGHYYFHVVEPPTSDEDYGRRKTMSDAEITFLYYIVHLKFLAFHVNCTKTIIYHKAASALRKVYINVTITIINALQMLKIAAPWVRAKPPARALHWLGRSGQEARTANGHVSQWFSLFPLTSYKFHTYQHETQLLSYIMWSTHELTDITVGVGEAKVTSTCTTYWHFQGWRHTDSLAGCSPRLWAS